MTAIDLGLRVVATRSRGGGLSIRVPVIGANIALGGKATRVRTQTIAITLVPPEREAGHEVRDGEVEDALVDAVATVRRVLAAATYGEDPWFLQSSTVELTFAVTETGTIAMGIDEENIDEFGHTLQLTLGPASGPDTCDPSNQRRV